MTGLAEPASIKASGFNLEFLGRDMLKVRCKERGKHVYIFVYHKYKYIYIYMCVCINIVKIIQYTTIRICTY